MVKVHDKHNLTQSPVLETTGDLTISTGDHSDHNTAYSNCIDGGGTGITVTAYRPGAINPRAYQHWRACQKDNDITIFLTENHPELTCTATPNTHRLEFTIGGSENYTITVKEQGCD